MKQVLFFPLFLLLFSCDKSGKESLLTSEAKENYFRQFRITDTTYNVEFFLFPDDVILHQDSFVSQKRLDIAFTQIGLVPPDSLWQVYYAGLHGDKIQINFNRKAEFETGMIRDTKKKRPVPELFDRIFADTNDIMGNPHTVGGIIDLVDKTIKINYVTPYSWETHIYYYFPDESLDLVLDGVEMENHPYVTDQFQKPLPDTMYFIQEFIWARDYPVGTDAIPLPERYRKYFTKTGLEFPDSVLVNSKRFSNHVDYSSPAMFAEFSYLNSTDYGNYLPFNNEKLNRKFMSREKDFSGYTYYLDLLYATIVLEESSGSHLVKTTFIFSGKDIWKIIESGNQYTEFEIYKNNKLIRKGVDDTFEYVNEYD